MSFQASTEDRIYNVSMVGARGWGGTGKQIKEAKGRTECGVRWGWRGGQRQTQAGSSRLQLIVYPTVGDN